MSENKTIEDTTVAEETKVTDEVVEKDKFNLDLHTYRLLSLIIKKQLNTY